jgi:ferric-dicitrate binding protein FerR (iron transport regulator)
MNEEQARELLRRYRMGLCDAEEVAIIEQWYGALADRQEWQWAPEQKQAFEDVLRRSLADAMKEDVMKDSPYLKGERRLSRLRRLSVAAAAVLLLVGGTLYLRNRYSRKPETVLPVVLGPLQRDAVPGGNKAVLTLADGTQVTLDSTANGNIAQQGNTKIVKLGSGLLAYKNPTAGHQEGVVYNMLSTPRGGEYQLTLPDGTRVWLNAASSLRYPAAFAGNERVVELKGEAYFEVAANASMPFYVQIQQLQIQVLGTRFNVMAYEDERLIKTTLLQGAVLVMKGDDKVVLQPGQEAGAARAGGRLQKAQVDATAAVAWKEGLFHYDHTDMLTIMRQLSRWYDIDIQYEGNVKDIYFSGQISRKNNLSQVLKMFALTKEVQFEITGKRLTVRSITADARQRDSTQ